MPPTDPARVPLLGYSSADLAVLAGRVAEEYARAQEREAAAIVTAHQQLTEAAERLGKHLGPAKPRAGNLQSLREACLLTPADLAAKSPEVMQLLLTSLRDVTEVAQQAVLIGAQQAR